MSRRVFFYVQHLLGIGHLKRASVLARAMAAAGLDVTVALGGPDVPGVRFDGCARILLPPIRAADATFSTLVDEDGLPVSEALKDARAARLVAEAEALRPQVLLIEQFPFGRRPFRFEILPLLAAARAATPRPRICASVRDVLVHQGKPERLAEMAGIARTFFDRIFVHGDAGVIPFDATFPRAGEIASQIVYTGYVVEAGSDNAADREAGRGEVIVSAGGGAVGEPMLRAALAARPSTRFARLPWRLVTGPNLPDPAFDSLAWDPPPGVIIERWRSDLSQLMRNCVLSVSQGGYNTLMDVVSAGCPAVIVPFAAAGQTEQFVRTQAFAERGLVSMVDEAALSPEAMAAAIDGARERNPRQSIIDLGGAEKTALLVASLCDDD